MKTLKQSLKNLKPIPVFEEFGRTIIKVDFVHEKDAQGNERVDLARNAKVMEVTKETKAWKKGDTVYYNPRGCVALEVFATKTYTMLVIDNCDVYAVLQ